MDSTMTLSYTHTGGPGQEEIKASDTKRGIMRKSINFTMIFVGGLLVGALFTFVILGKLTYQYSDYYMQAASQQVFIASELRANRNSELQGRTEANLPAIVLTIHNNRQLRNASGAPAVLRQIRDFYELNSLPVPSEISGILNEVPPRTH
jgi:hypothetical protein